MVKKQLAVCAGHGAKIGRKVDGPWWMVDGLLQISETLATTTPSWATKRFWGDGKLIKKEHNNNCALQKVIHLCTIDRGPWTNYSLRFISGFAWGGREGAEYYFRLLLFLLYFPLPFEVLPCNISSIQVPKVTKPGTLFCSRVFSIR